jgi:acylphosphatase
MKQHLEISVSGRVQGVGFRYQAKEIADELGVRGYARNMRDGSVSIEAEGNVESLNKFQEILKGSPGISNVQNVEVKKGQNKHYREFTVY